MLKINTILSIILEIIRFFIPFVFFILWLFTFIEEVGLNQGFEGVISIVLSICLTIASFYLYVNFINDPIQNFFQELEQQKIQNELLSKQENEQKKLFEEHQILAGDVNNKKLHIYLSSIVKNISEAKTDIKPEDNILLMTLINDSIDNRLVLTSIIFQDIRKFS